MTEKQTNIKFLIIIGIFFILFFVKPEIGQSQRALSIGGKKWGIAFGSPIDYYGLRFNLFDLKTTKKTSGLSFSLKNQCTIVNGIKIGIINTPICYINKERSIINYPKTNGLQIGIINSPKTSINGICIGALNKGWRINGLNLGLLYSRFTEINGILICPISKVSFINGISVGLFNIVENINGIQVGLFNKTNEGFSLGSLSEGSSPDQQGIKGIQVALYNFNERAFFGIQMGILNYNNKATGIGVGLINICNSGQSVQFGLLNFRKNNKWFAKVLPIVNFKIGNEEAKQKVKKHGNSHNNM